MTQHPTRKEAGVPSRVQTPRQSSAFPSAQRPTDTPAQPKEQRFHPPGAYKYFCSRGISQAAWQSHQPAFALALSEMLCSAHGACSRYAWHQAHSWRLPPPLNNYDYKRSVVLLKLLVTELTIGFNGGIGTVLANALIPSIPACLLYANAQLESRTGLAGFGWFVTSSRIAYLMSSTWVERSTIHSKAGRATSGWYWGRKPVRGMGEGAVYAPEARHAQL